MNSLAIAELSQARAGCELRLLCAVASAGLWGWSLAHRLGIEPDHFGEVDCHLLAEVLDVCGLAGITDRLVTAKHCRAALKLAGWWDDADERPFLTGCMTWGPGPLSRLFCGLTVTQAEKAIPQVIRELADLDRQREAVAEGRAAA